MRGGSGEGGAVLFATREWIAALVEALNRHPELPRALAGLGADLAVVVDPEPPRFPRAVTAYGRQELGRIVSWRVLVDDDEILELEPAYVVRAPYRVWRELLAGADPVKAALSGRVKVQGDLEALVRRAGYRRIIEDALAGIDTRFE